jgi:hypothetical protein
MLNVVIFLLSTSIVLANLLAAQTVEEMVKRFLPQGATLETIRSFDPVTDRETVALAVKGGRASQNGDKYLSFVYSRVKDKESLHLRIRVVQNPEGRPSILEQVIPGTFLWMQDYKTNGFQVIDLNGDNVDEIVTITSEGASLGAYLNVFTVRAGRFVSILEKPGGYEVGGYEFKFDPGPDKKHSIIVYGKDRSSYQIYRWDGTKFKIQNT